MALTCRTMLWPIFILLSQCTLRSLSSMGYLGTKTANKCFSVAGVPRMDFNQCQPNEMILIMNAVQGIGKRPGQCIYRHGDCTEPPSTETDAKLHDACIGRNACSIPVSVTWMGKCNAYSSYNYAIYQCIPRNEVADVCARIEKTSFRTAFIMSSGYPEAYTANLECRCNITTDLDQRILLKFADYNLEWSENCENDVVQVSDGGSRMPRCGQLPRNYNITSRNNKVQLYFKTDQWQQRKGFLLQVEALGKLHVSCTPANWEPTTTTTSTTTTTLTSTAAMDTSPDDRFPPDGGRNGGFGGRDGDGSGGYPYPPWAFITPKDEYGKNSPYDNYAQQAEPNENDKMGYLGLGLGSYLIADLITSLVIEHQVGIIIGCVVAVLLLLLLIFGVIWYKKRRHKEEISHIPNESSYLAKLNKRPLTDHSGLQAGYDVNPPSSRG